MIADAGMRLGEELMAVGSPRQTTTTLFGTVTKDNGDGTLNLDVEGGTLLKVPMTTACKGVAVGDRVVVTTYGRLSVVTGVIAHDNSYYVKQLWHNDTGYYMNASQTANLSEKVSDQRTGIVLHWQAYVSGSVKNYDHNFFFVPKSHVSRNPGGGVAMFLTVSTANAVTTKYVYVNDDRITGNDVNGQDPSTANSGISKTPKYFVLTEVLGV